MLTVGGESHDLARIFAGFSPAKKVKYRKSGLSGKLARLLYGKRQVQALILEYRSD
jgi:hypothetical protein